LNSGPAESFLLLVIVGSSTATVVAFFIDHNLNPTFITHCDPRDKGWVFVTPLS
jgi:hypothetical protein